MGLIHATAIIDPSAALAKSVAVGPYAVIGANVEVDEGTTIGAHAVIEGPTTIGRDNRIFAHAVLGGAPQDMKYRTKASVDGETAVEAELMCTMRKVT